MLIHRRYIGLAAAASLTIHFGYVVAFLVTSGQPLEWVTAVFAGGAFVLMWAMALTSTGASRRWLGSLKAASYLWPALCLADFHAQTFIGVFTGGLTMVK